MQIRTKNEKILIAILVGILFAGGNYYGYQWLSHKLSSLDMKYAELRADRADAEIDLQKSDLWSQRKEWLKAHEPVLKGEDSAKAEVLEQALKGARDHHLQILEQSINDIQHGATSTRINVSVKVKGDMQSFCQWLTELQKPENFYAVSLFSMKADEDQKSMVGTLQLSRYFKGGS